MDSIENSVAKKAYEDKLWEDLKNLQYGFLKVHELNSQCEEAVNDKSSLPF